MLIVFSKPLPVYHGGMQQLAPNTLNRRVAWPPPGRYLLAVSGGADSMVLLDLMARVVVARGYQLTVGHFDHGLRPDSAADRDVVATAAQRYSLPLAAARANLAPGTSEAAARAARHAWLQAARRHHQAQAVVTAHHQDDLIETSLLNLARGSGRRGLAPMHTGPILRPLLNLTRADLRAHATHHHLTWREDPTNAELTNPRNYLRHQLLPYATPQWRRRYLQHINRLATLNHHIDHQLATILATHHHPDIGYAFPRPLIRDLSPTELQELLLAAALNLQPALQLSQRLIHEMVMFAKTSPPHRHRPLRQGLNIVVEPTTIWLKIANPPQN